ncbi:hypothetical protein DID74_02350 [Candidatus Marinamargulisbacteria bacterium SCGC AG-333-B06]|nr:hypothetical protein DID74_02350 [Candidatus Marinamargulisbacteria bacterium SCGC AG-333-B06]
MTKKKGRISVKRILIIGLILILSGCAAVTDLLKTENNDIEDILSTAIAKVTGQISYNKTDIISFVDTNATNATINCDDYTKDIDILLYQIDTDTLSLKDSAPIITNIVSNETECLYHYEIDNISDGPTTIESIMKKLNNNDTLVQRASSSLIPGKTNVFEKITADTADTSDRLLPILLEKLQSTFKHLDDETLNIITVDLIELIREIVDQELQSLENQNNFVKSNNKILQPMYQEFGDTNGKRIELEKIKNSERYKGDYNHMKTICDTNVAISNFKEGVNLQNDMKHNSNNKNTARNIFQKVFGEDMIENHPAAVELMIDAYKDNAKVTLEDIAKAIWAAMDFNGAKNDQDINYEMNPLPQSDADILNFTKDEITEEQGLINNIFETYNNQNITFTEKYIKESYRSTDYNTAIGTSYGIQSVFPKNHRWNQKTNVSNDETVNILELWTLLMMYIDKGYLHEDYFDMTVFFYNLDILNMEKPFVVEVYIDEDDNTKELLISVIDTKRKVQKIKASIYFENTTNSEITQKDIVITEIVENANNNDNNLDKIFSLNLNSDEYIDLIIKAKEIELVLLDSNNNPLAKHTQKLLSFEDIVQDYTNQSYEYGFPFSDDEIGDNQESIEIVETDSNQDSTVDSEKSIDGKSENNGFILIKEGDSHIIIFKDQKIEQNLHNNYLSDYAIEYEFRIIEVIKAHDNNPLDNIDNEWDDYTLNNSNQVTLAEKTVAKGNFSEINGQFQISLPTLKANEYNANESYHTYYRLDIRSIIIDQNTGFKITHSHWLGFKYFVQPVTF